MEMETWRSFYSGYSYLTDEEWFELLIKSLHQRVPGLPGFPPASTQQIFVGRSGESALKEAFDFYKLIKSRSSPWSSETKVLDFGVGWGRIIRFFSKDISAHNLYGVDVDQTIVRESELMGVPGKLQVIDPKGTLPFEDATFDVVYAFSVFSHLSKESAKIWLAELARVMKPGGTLVLTTTTNRFLDLCRACKEKTGGANSFEDHLGGLFGDPRAALAAYSRGEHVYSGSGGNSSVLSAENYGWAAMPPKFVKSELSSEAESIEFFDEPDKFEQGVFVIKKKAKGFKSSLLRKIRRLLSLVPG